MHLRDAIISCIDLDELRQYRWVHVSSEVDHSRKILLASLRAKEGPPSGANAMFNYTEGNSLGKHPLHYRYFSFVEQYHLIMCITAGQEDAMLRLQDIVGAIASGEGKFSEMWLEFFSEVLCCTGRYDNFDEDLLLNVFPRIAQGVSHLTQKGFLHNSKLIGQLALRITPCCESARALLADSVVQSAIETLLLEDENPCASTLLKARVSEHAGREKAAAVTIPECST